MKNEIEIRFRNSASSSLEGILNKASQFKIFEKAKNRSDLNKIKMDIKEVIEKFSIYRDIISAVDSWKGTEFYFNEIPQNRTQLFEFEKTLSCFGEFQKAIIQESHCKINSDKEGWGCKQLSSISRYSDTNYPSYTKIKGWYEFGEFISDKIWKINKNEILRILEREADLKHIYHCPKFDITKLKEIVKNLNDEINLEESNAWEINYELTENGAQVEKKLIGIIPKKSYRDKLGIRLSFNDDEDEVENKNKRFIPDVSYEDIGGIDDILQKIREVIEIPIRRPDLFSYLGIKSHKGILLYGLPGCGKTLVAKAIANQVKAHFISVKGPELISKFLGQSEENLRGVFEEARQLQPSIIFFDEIDSIAQRRSADENLRTDSRFVNQLLTLMDGLEEYYNVKIIATTNRIELIDEALLRSGRFDYHIEINKPNKEGCIKIFNIHTEKMPIEKSFDKNYFASKFIGLTGADIAFITREGAYNCLRRNLKSKLYNLKYDFDEIDFKNFIIKEEDFQKALDSIKK